MNTYANATSSKHPTLGSDAWVIIDGRLSLNNQSLFAKAHFNSLRIIHPSYDGYDILRGASISTAKVIKSFIL